MVVQGMKEGAVGLSTGLEYLPGAYALTDELVALCELPVGRAKGVYVAHMRSYRPDRVALAAFAETVEIGRRARLLPCTSPYSPTAGPSSSAPLLQTAARADRFGPAPTKATPTWPAAPSWP